MLCDAHRAQCVRVPHVRRRGRATPAYAHALSAGHHVWVGVTPPEGAATAGGVSSGWRPRFWCLPDGYEVVDASLEDVATALRPTFSGSALRALDASPALSRDAAGAPFLPGYVGVNNLGHTDGTVALVQALAHVAPQRNYFLAELTCKHEIFAPRTDKTKVAFSPAKNTRRPPPPPSPNTAPASLAPRVPHPLLHARPQLWQRH
jgi:hypothetical protein